MKNYLLTLPAIALLAACGGGGGGSMIEDQPGFEDATDEEIEDAETVEEEEEETGSTGYQPPIPVGSAVTLPTANIIDIQRRNASDALISQSDLQPEQGTVGLTATLNADGSITLSDGVRSVVVAANSDGNFVGDGGTSGDETTEISGFLRPRSTGSADVHSAFINFTDYNTRREGNIVIGEVTDGATANALTGTATYRGLMHARMTGPNGPVRYDALGGGRLIADFDGGTISGRFNLTAPNAPLFEDAAADQFPRVLVELNSSGIANGAFGGTVDVTFKDGGGLGNPDLAFSNGSYNGNLFGNAGGSAGGTFIGDVTDGADTLIMQGSFATEAE